VHPDELAVAPFAGPACAGEWFALFRDHYLRILSLLVRLTGDRGQAE
jgi:hypothetical protein